MERILLLVPATSYRVKDFLTAAHRSGAEVTVGSNVEVVFNAFETASHLPLPFDNLPSCVEIIATFHETHPLVAIIGVDEPTALLAAEASKQLGLTHNTPDSVAITGNKLRLRETLSAARLPSPSFTPISSEAALSTALPVIDFPCVIKPVGESASRGVIRANDEAELRAAYDRLQTMLPGGDVIVEDFLPGKEVALEGLMVDGRLITLALFDKPDPLDGPYFEETIYVTPSQQEADIQDSLHRMTQEAAAALGLTDGPIHAELRLRDGEAASNQQGPWIIEIAARSIGGLCSRSLSFDNGTSLEEIIVSNALGAEVSAPSPDAKASGVMMIPVPAAGVLRRIDGDIDARAVDHITNLEFSIRPGQEVVPLPEGNQYLGFIFARGPDPATVEEALRKAHAFLRFEIEPLA